MKMAMGAPLSMAPELLSDDDEYSVLIDVYAYGVLVYSAFASQHMLTNRRYQSPTALLMRVQQGDRFQRQPGIPDPF
jgi:serine/threonine protein kinase